MDHHLQFIIYQLVKDFTSKTFKRTLRPNDPELPYSRRTDVVKSVLHWGQRKLMLSEIEFLTLRSQPGDHVVYAGSAPGIHMPSLAAMFPDLTFDLWDPARFKIKKEEKIKLFNDYFTPIIAERYSVNERGNRRLLFISDLRTGEHDERIADDMKLQADCIDVMQPDYSMVKFRFPYCRSAGEKFEYFAGEVFLQAFPGPTSTETRLHIARDAEKVMWDICKYDNQLYYHEVVNRARRYPHPMKQVPGIDMCYDCRSEYEILMAYLRKYHPRDANVEIAGKLSIAITRDLGFKSMRDYYLYKTGQDYKLTTPAIIRTII